MRKAFAKSGWPTLFEDGLQKVKKGITTIEEVLRVTEEVRLEEEPASNVSVLSPKTAAESVSADWGAAAAAKKKKTDRTRKKEAAATHQEGLSASEGDSQTEENPAAVPSGKPAVHPAETSADLDLITSTEQERARKKP
jgi:hypothetical protein